METPHSASGIPARPPFASLRGYRAHRLALACLLIGYALAGTAFRWTMPGGEVFPVFSWTLFTYVPAETLTEFEVEVLALRGETLDESLPYHEARGVLPGAGTARAHRVVHRLGQAVESGDETEVDALRRLFENEYLGAGQQPATYAVVRRTYSPLERWRTGETSTTQLARFESGPR